jgi:hypothetical protein
MKFTAFDRTTRQVLFAGTTDSTDGFGENVEVLDGFEYQGDGWVGESGEYHPVPEQPSPHHVFNYTAKQWEDPRTPETEWPVVRAQRNALLSASDWTQLPDVPLATKEAWAVYRQGLRDVTMQSDPFAIDWPVAPGS